MPSPHHRADRPAPKGPGEGERRWLNRGVLGVSAASFFSDSGHEMTTSLLPSMVSALGAGAGALGVIEGISDALTGISKLVGGPLAVEPRRRTRLATSGYAGTAVLTGLIGLTVAVWQVAALRGLAWISRGVRGPARDMMLTSVVPRSAYGRAAGAERAGDNAGAILGPLLASGLVILVGLRTTLVLAVVPGLLAAFSITVAAREAMRRGQAVESPKATLRLRLGELRAAGLFATLAPVALFELGNLATTLLILRATGVFEAGGSSSTHAVSLAVLLYAGYNTVATLTSLLAGSLTDRFGGRRVMVLAAGAFVPGYAALAVAQDQVWLVSVGFVLAGVGIGMGETAEKGWVAVGVPDSLRANAFGLLGLIQAGGDIGATLVAGLLWAAVSAQAAFLYAATWMVLAAAAAVVVGLAGRDRGAV